MSVNEVKLKRALEDFKVLGAGDPGSRTFAIGNEDHTLGNALRHILINMGDRVELAGYSVPHPSEPVMNLRVQTIKPKENPAGEETESRPTAVAVLKESCQCLSDICDFVLTEQIEKKIPEVKTDRERIEQYLAEYEADYLEEEAEEEDNNEENGEEGDESSIPDQMEFQEEY